MTRTTVRHRRGVVLLTLVGSLLGAGPASAADPVTLSAGHVDYGVRVVGGALRSQVKDGTGPTVVWREPGDVRFRLTAAARTTVPSSSSFGFLGTAGATTWLVPQSQKADVVWLGWNTEELTPASGATGTVT